MSAGLFRPEISEWPRREVDFLRGLPVLRHIIALVPWPLAPLEPRRLPAFAVAAGLKTPRCPVPLREVRRLPILPARPLVV